MIWNNSSYNFYEPKYFCVEEFVDPDTYKRFGNDALKVMDIRILKTADRMRKYFNCPITINNWKWKLSRKHSGIRTPKSPWFSTYSQHSFGRALDMLVKNYSADEVRKEILKKPWHKAFKYITSIETNISWVHVDCRIYDKKHKGIFKFTPFKK